MQTSRTVRQHESRIVVGNEVSITNPCPDRPCCKCFADSHASVELGLATASKNLLKGSPTAGEIYESWLGQEEQRPRSVECGLWDGRVWKAALPVGKLLTYVILEPILGLELTSIHFGLISLDSNFAARPAQR